MTRTRRHYMPALRSVSRQDVGEVPQAPPLHAQQRAQRAAAAQVRHARRRRPGAPGQACHAARQAQGARQPITPRPPGATCAVGTQCDSPRALPDRPLHEHAVRSRHRFHLEPATVPRLGLHGAPPWLLRRRRAARARAARAPRTSAATPSRPARSSWPISPSPSPSGETQSLRTCCSPWPRARLLGHWRRQGARVQISATSIAVACVCTHACAGRRASCGRASGSTCTSSSRTAPSWCTPRRLA